jgi:gamma-glutamyltranspeptidase/glutathione hydrolase
MIVRPPAVAANGMMVASHPLAVEAGIAMLRAGGSAIDALVAAAAVLSVVEPSASGIGGDAFFLVHDAAENRVRALNGSGVAPAALTASRFPGRDTVPLRAPLSCTVPGAVQAWEDAWKRWGKLPWEELLAPAVHHAQNGFPISWRMGRVLTSNAATISRDPGLSATYLDSEGASLRAGSICRPHSLARTLEEIRRDGASSFYRGRIAEQLARGTERDGGALSAADLAAHKSVFAEPCRLDRGPVAIFEQPLPSQGLLLLVMLGLVSEGERPSSSDSFEELHRQIESKKIAFAVKESFLTDPGRLPVPESELIDALTSSATLQRLGRLLEQEPLPVSLASEVVVNALSEAGPRSRALIDAYRAAGFDPAHPPLPGDGATDTTYLCAADRDGNMAGLIQSIFHPFGCGYQEPATGILLNNRACGFSLDARHINSLVPGWRTVHTLNSFLIHHEGRPWIVAGTPGGDNQVQTNLQVVRHWISGDCLWAGPQPRVPGWSQARQPRVLEPLPEMERLAAALAAPRWRVERSGRVRVESRMPAEYSKRLARRGHVVARVGPWEGSGLVQAVVLSRDSSRSGAGRVYLGATDPRGEGVALGF